MSLYMGVDVGTHGVRVGLFDLERGKITHVAESGYETSYPADGFAEQSADDWWTALGSASRRLMAEAGHPPVAAMCVATTASTVVTTRENGRTLRRAILWMDARAEAESRESAAVEHPLMGPDGDASEWLVPKAMWLARHEPETYARAERITEAIDWLNHKLTGRWVASRMNAVCKWNYDPDTDHYPSDLYTELGIPDLADKLPAPVIPVGEPIGHLTEAAAHHLGLSRETRAVQGGIDAHVGMLGAGATEPGDLLFIGGTSNVHLTHTATATEVPGVWGPYPNALTDGSWLLEGGQVSSGSILDWLTDAIFELDDAGHRKLIEHAARFAPGETGLLALDFWMGNRSPYRDPSLRGAIFGLSLHHRRRHLYRACVEAIALGAANVFAALAKRDVAVNRVIAAGGFQKNRLWLKATVNASGVPFELAATDNLTLLGTAASAACGDGTFPSLRAAAAALATTGERLEPDPVEHDAYQRLLARYRDAVARMGGQLRAEADTPVQEARA